MSLATFAERTRLGSRFRRAAVRFWIPLFAAAVIPIIITGAAVLPWTALGGLLIVVSLAAGIFAARVQTEDAGHQTWVLQASLLPFAVYGATVERSWGDYLLLAFWAGTVLANAVGAGQGQRKARIR